MASKKFCPKALLCVLSSCVFFVQSLSCIDDTVGTYTCPNRFEIKPGAETITCHGSCSDSRCCLEVWRSSVDFSWDSLLNSQSDSLKWVKFTLILEEQVPGQGGVYFQNSRKQDGLAFHYQFASKHLSAFQGFTPEQFNNVTLFNAHRRAVLGAVIYPNGQPEYAIQISASEPPETGDLVAWLDQIKSQVVPQASWDGQVTEVTAFYLPTPALRPHAEAYSEALKTAGFEVASALRWSTGDVVYAPGWAVGRLIFVTTDNISKEFTAGKLLSTDILLTDGVPAEVPPLAGIISLSPATPNSHVAILSQTFGNPFVFVNREVLKDYENQTVMLLAPQQTGSSVDVSPLELEPRVLQELLNVKDGGKLDIKPVLRAGYYTPATRALMANMSHFGGKAKNFPLLMSTIPDNTVKYASAFSFDLWLDFAELTPPNTNTSLKQLIAAKLQGTQGQPQYVLDAALKEIRDSIEDTEFSTALKTVVIDALSGPEWMELAKIRFRSSTNVEDSELFTGAGLYDSKSGCLADDLDADEDGPSLCEPEERKEKGVFRALRKVWASFYNTNAYLARMRLQVPEDEAGMAVLVHHNFPDPLELANGVCTLKIFYTSSWDKSLSLKRDVLCVSQKGATSVTNAEPGFVAEEVELKWTWNSNSRAFEVEMSVPKASSLTLLGELVLGSDGAYRQLADLLIKVADTYGDLAGLPHYTKPGDDGYGAAETFTSLWLEFEYKNMNSSGAARPEGGLVVKQVRPMPRTQTIEASYLMPQTILLESVSGHDASTDALANQRTKVKVEAQTIPMLLSKARLEEERTIFSQLTITVHDICNVVQLGPSSPMDLPGAEQQAEIVDQSGKQEVVVTFSFRVGPRKYTLTFPHIPLVPNDNNIAPLFLDKYITWSARTKVAVAYDRGAQPFDIRGQPVALESSWIASPEVATETVHEMNFVDTQQSELVTFRILYHRSPSPTGISAGFTWSIPRFVNTTIKGLTIEPLVLGDGYFVQSYAAFHHNFEGTFAFHLTREASLTAQQRLELAIKQVASVYVHVRGSGPDPSLERIVYFDQIEMDGYRDEECHTTPNTTPNITTTVASMSFAGSVCGLCTSTILGLLISIAVAT